MQGKRKQQNWIIKVYYSLPTITILNFWNRMKLHVLVFWITKQTYVNIAFFSSFKHQFASQNNIDISGELPLPRVSNSNWESSPTGTITKASGSSHKQTVSVADNQVWSFFPFRSPFLHGNMG